MDESIILDDTMTALPPEKRINWNYSSGSGYTPFEQKAKSVYKHIDHVYYTPSKIEVLTWWLDVETVNDGKYASDHHPITVDLKFYK